MRLRSFCSSVVPLLICVGVVLAVFGCERDEDTHQPDEIAEPRQPTESGDDETAPGAVGEPPMPADDELLDDKSDDPQFDVDRAAVSDIEAVDEPDDAFELVRHYQLDDVDFAAVALWRLQVLRNAPFARAGYEFSTPWLDAYFWRQPAAYDPGDFDDGELTPLERHNVQRIRDYERRISDEELRDRWENLWSEYDVDAPDGPWEVPGPWERIEDRLEARILAEHLDISSPPDPMFDAGATRPIPRGFDGVEQGGEVPVDLQEVQQRRTVRPAFLFDELTLGVAEDDGVVRDVYLGALYNPQGGRPASHEDQVTSLEKQIVAAFGSPDESDYRAAWIGDAPLWRAEDRVMMVGFRGGIEEAGAVVAIRPADPTRPCGPDDGFDEVLEAIATAFDDGDLDAFAQHLSDDLTTQGRPITSDGKPSPDAEGLGGRDFLSYKEVFAIDDIDGDNWREARHGCAPFLAQQKISREGAMLHYAFRRIDGKWKLTSIREWVAASYPVSRD